MKEHNLKSKDFYLDEIESIECIGEIDSVDIEVEDTHMFYADDIYTHNSALNSQVVNIEQIAESYGKACVVDVLITLARTREDKIANVGRFHLAKNRFGPDGIVFPAKINLANVDIELFEYSEEEYNNNNKQENTSENIRQLFNQYAVKNLNKQAMEEEEKGK